MKMHQVIFALLALAAVVEAIPRHQKALRTEWDTWKELHGNVHKFNLPQVVRLSSFLSKATFLVQEEATPPKRKRASA